MQPASITTYHCLPNSWPIRDSESCRTLLLLVLPPTPVHLWGMTFLCTCNLTAPITHHSCRITAKHLPHQPSPVTCPLPCVLTSLSKSMLNDFNPSLSYSSASFQHPNNVKTDLESSIKDRSDHVFRYPVTQLLTEISTLKPHTEKHEIFKISTHFPISCDNHIT